ncbi:hypothetical protein ACFXPA_23340 [Amycolatopsis sp. NPDC059090]|uniref:hypothetical protein n=1 Tax=Amycolatopsis sp. NPDC059090 TaxID=3346723 RepID=UPI00367129FE
MQHASSYRLSLLDKDFEGRGVAEGGEGVIAGADGGAGVAVGLQTRTIRPHNLPAATRSCRIGSASGEVADAVSIRAAARHRAAEARVRRASSYGARVQ